MDTGFVNAIRTILSENLEADMYALDFTKLHFDALLQSLENRFPPSVVREKRGAIKQAISDHFAQTYQEVTLSIYDERIEVSKVFIDPARDEQYDRAVFRCDLKLIEIKNDPRRYRPVEILWSIHNDRRVELFGYFKESRLSQEAVKEIIRQRFERCFELDETEIVLYLRNNIYIRKNVAIRKKMTGERRFEGKSAEEMEQLCTAYFEEGVWCELESMLPDTLADRLNFSTIGNRRFIRTFIPVFRSMVEVMLMEKIKQIGKEDLVAFSGYILRQQFDAILAFTAQNLLEHIEQRDKNAETFIKYYNGDTVIDEDGNRIVQHAILDANSQKWNYSAILSILIQWKETKSRSRSYEEKLKQLLAKQEYAQGALEKLEPAKESADREIEVMKSRINDNRKAFKKLKLESERSSAAMKANRSELVALRDRDRDLIASLKKLYEKHEQLLKSYENREKEFRAWQKQIADLARQFKEILAQKKAIKSNYDGIVRGLITVFAKR